MTNEEFYGSALEGMKQAEYRLLELVRVIVELKCVDHESETAAKAYLDKMTYKCTVKSKTAQKELIELNLEIRLKDDNTDFINALFEMDGVNSAVPVSYNGDYMG